MHLLSVMLFVTYTGLTSYAQDSTVCPLVHEQAVVVFIDPTEEEIEKMKKEVGEDDFYAIADDILYYRYNAQEYLKELGFPFCFTKEEKHKFIMADNKKLSFEKKCNDWSLVLWNGKEEPICASAVDILLHEQYLKAAKR